MEPEIEEMADGIAEQAQKLSERLEQQERLTDGLAEEAKVLRKTVETQRKNIADLLQHVGGKGVCSGKRCRQEIYWVFHRDTGQKMPYNLDGSTHWTTCVDRDSFRRK